MPEAAGLYYETHGAADAPPLILSAGMGGSAKYWTPNIASLAERYRVIAYDHRGTGRSDRELPGEATIEQIGMDIVALMDALGIPRVTIIGHAIGGMAGLAVALAAPERVERLVIVNGWARLDPYTARCFDTRLTLLRDSGPQAYIHAQPIFLYPPKWISDHHAHLAEEEAVQVADFPAQNIERRVLGACRFDVADRLHEVATPTLLVASSDDALVPPACSSVLAAGISGATLKTMSWGGHACNVTDPDTFNALIRDFLGS